MKCYVQRRGEKKRLILTPVIRYSPTLSGALQQGAINPETRDIEWLDFPFDVTVDLEDPPPAVDISEPGDFILTAAKPLFDVIRQLDEGGCRVRHQREALQGLVAQLEQAFAGRR